MHNFLVIHNWSNRQYHFRRWKWKSRFFSQSTHFEKHQQWEKLTKVERVGGSGSGNKDQAWGKKHRPDHRPLFEDPCALFPSLLFCLKAVQCPEAVPSTAPRRLCRPLCVDCVGLFEVLRMRCPLTSSLRRSTTPLLPEYHKYIPLFTDDCFENCKIIWDILCKLKGCSQVLK